MDPSAQRTRPTGNPRPTHGGAPTKILATLAAARPAAITKRSDT